MGYDEAIAPVLEDDSSKTVVEPNRSPQGSIEPEPAAEAILPSKEEHSIPQTKDEEPELSPDNVEALSRVSSGPPYSAFSHSTRRWITAMLAAGSFVSPMTATIYYPALNALSEDMRVSVSLINLTITSYMIFQGLAPTMYGEFGDMAGRRPAYILGFSIYIAANVGLALQNNYAALLVLRCLQSAGSSGTIALGFASVADIASTAERGRYMGAVGAGINIGPTFGPFLGGLLTQYLGWRAIFWFCAILTGAWLIPYILFVPETSRRVVGNGSIPPQGWNMTLVDFIRFRRLSKQRDPAQERKLHFPNPFHTFKIIFQKEMGLILFYNSILYAIFVVVNATLSTQFKIIYNLNNLQIGLCYLPYGFGSLISNLIQGYILDWNYRRTARKIGFTISRRRGDDLSKYPIEKARIQPIYPILAIGLVAVGGYGWVLHARASLALPLIIQFFIGFCITGSFSILNTLIVDLTPEAPGMATAANNVVRCIMGAIGTAIIESMIIGMGQGWCFTFLALLCTALAPMLWVVVRCGPEWRKEKAARLRGEDR